jgi:hypothetical protein
MKINGSCHRGAGIGESRQVDTLWSTCNHWKDRQLSRGDKEDYGCEGYSSP